MKNYFSKDFPELYKQLPDFVRKQASKAFDRLEENPQYPGLNFKCVNKKYRQYSIRIGKDYRALGYLYGDTIKWNWIGPHDEYERRID